MTKNKSQSNGSMVPISDALGQTGAGLLEGVTGVVASTRKELIVSAGQILQRARGGKFTAALRKEWDQYKEKGRIKDDYEFTEQCQVCLQELLDFLDKGLPDEERFKVLKQIFLVAATEEASNRDDHLPLQYMQIARTLTAGEVLVLNTTYRLAKQGKSFAGGGGMTDVDNWLRGIARESGLVHRELVEIHEAKLNEKHLLTNRKMTDAPGAYIGGSVSRLTMLGHGLCEYIDHYNKSADASKEETTQTE